MATGWPQPNRNLIAAQYRSRKLSQKVDKSRYFYFREQVQLLKLKPKERTAIERVKMPELDADYRAKTRLEEVNIGLTPEMAMQEAKRCLDCPKPSCVEGCPVNIHIPDFIKNIERGDFLEAAKILKETSALPAVCGRVCPQEKQCESRCIHLKMNSPAVAIGYLERFAADYERESGHMALPDVAPSNGIKVAVLSRGYKRKSCGYVLANENTPMREIGDEPYQMKTKFPDIRVAVDKKRCEGIDRLTSDEETKDTDVILLDDAFQHRYVHPGINILLVDYHRLIIYEISLISLDKDSINYFPFISI